MKFKINSVLIRDWILITIICSLISITIFLTGTITKLFLEAIIDKKIEQVQHDAQGHRKTIKRLKEEIKQIDNNMVALHKRIVAITITAYPPLEKHTDSTPRITASGKEVEEDVTLALSPELEWDFGLLFGDCITVIGVGELEFQDRMSKYTIGYRADVFKEEYRTCINFGVKQAMLILPEVE